KGRDNLGEGEKIKPIDILTSINNLTRKILFHNEENSIYIKTTKLLSTLIPLIALKNSHKIMWV
ncbi:hypothetical protein DMP16_08060, partial [Sulfolobus sp. B1]|uniref:hypothetical protein n=1 Tax=Sulfolobus sp. B1 TaxID=2200888 RepID=UPI001193B2BF